MRSQATDAPIRDLCIRGWAYAPGCIPLPLAGKKTYG